MKFRFEKTEEVDTRAWNRTNEKLMDDLKKIAGNEEVMSTEEACAYARDAMAAMEEFENRNSNEKFLFLMFDKPNTMPADARVDYVYRPTYIIATILMTLACRYEEVWKIEGFEKMMAALLKSAAGRRFLGAGYEEYEGLLDTFRIFATGDTIRFLDEYGDICPPFTAQFDFAVDFIYTGLLSGKVKRGWYGDKDFIDEAMEVRNMLGLQKKNRSEVWYACYGSNVNTERFMKYINDIDDKTPPMEERPFEFPYPMYFAKHACTWDNCGKAFLDVNAEGKALGKIYRIKEEQYIDICAKEGRDYRKRVELGKIDDIPVYSFTDTQTNEEKVLPSYRYYNTILEGLKDCYKDRMSEKDIVEYLNGTVMTGDEYAVTMAVKNSDHAIPVEKIMEMTGLDEDTVLQAVHSLMETGMLVLDSRNGCLWNQAGALFYTKNAVNARMLAQAMKGGN